MAYLRPPQLRVFLPLAFMGAYWLVAVLIQGGLHPFVSLLNRYEGDTGYRLVIAAMARGDWSATFVADAPPQGLCGVPFLPGALYALFYRWMGTCGFVCGDLLFGLLLFKVMRTFFSRFTRPPDAAAAALLALAAAVIIPNATGHYFTTLSLRFPRPFLSNIGLFACLTACLDIWAARRSGWPGLEVTGRFAASLAWLMHCDSYTGLCTGGFSAILFLSALRDAPRRSSWGGASLLALAGAALLTSPAFVQNAMAAPDQLVRMGFHPLVDRGRLLASYWTDPAVGVAYAQVGLLALVATRLSGLRSGERPQGAHVGVLLSAAAMCGPAGSAYFILFPKGIQIYHFLESMNNLILLALLAVCGECHTRLSQRFSREASAVVALCLFLGFTALNRWLLPLPGRAVAAAVAAVLLGAGGLWLLEWAAVLRRLLAVAVLPALLAAVIGANVLAQCRMPAPRGLADVPNDGNGGGKVAPANWKKELTATLRFLESMQLPSSSVLEGDESVELWWAMERGGRVLLPDTFASTISDQEVERRWVEKARRFDLPPLPDATLFHQKYQASLAHLPFPLHDYEPEVRAFVASSKWRDNWHCALPVSEGKRLSGLASSPPPAMRLDIMVLPSDQTPPQAVCVNRNSLLAVWVPRGPQ